MHIPTKAVENWDNLLGIDDKQFSVARNIVERRSNEWLKTYPNVLSVSAGYRNPEPGEESCHEVCLRFEVKRKKKTVATNEIVPERILGYYESEEGRIPVAIPTDVYHTSSGGLHNTWPTNFFYGYGRINNQFKREPGSACCVLRADSTAESGENFSGLVLLSCAHVFNLVKKNSFRVFRDSAIFRKVSNGGDYQIGRTLATGPFNAHASPVAFTLDASLAKLDQNIDPHALANMVDPHPTALADQGVSHADLSVSGVWGKDRVRFLGYVQRRKFKIAPGIYIRIRGAYMYASQKTSDPEGIRPGYSGSPLIDAQGRIYGMHFYGGEYDERGNALGYALPIMDILRFFETNYGLQMQLAAI